MTLVETAVAVAVIGILVGGVVRGWSVAADRARVVEAQSQVLEGYRTAQSAARTQGRSAVLLVAPDRLEVTSAGLTDTISIWVRPGPAAVGVTIAPARHVVVFGPSGMANGAANVTHSFSRGAVTRQLIVSRLGRVRVN
jgi:type II secretory pathway pseudopilin PulG